MALDFFVVNVSIPSIRDSLHATFAEVQLVIASYGLTYAVLLISGGRLGDIYGRRRMFMWGVAAFTAASLLCGLAPTPVFLIAARALQGVAGALLFPQVLAIMQVTFPITERVQTEFRTEVFNLTNTPPLGNPNGSFGTAAFGTITSALDPRVFELVLKLHF